MRCKLCEESFNVDNMGEAGLTSYAKGTKHIQNEKTARDGLPTQAFFNSTKTTARPASRLVSASDLSTVATAKQSTLNVKPTPTASATSATEIRWARKVADWDWDKLRVIFENRKAVSLYYSDSFPYVSGYTMQNFRLI